MSEDISDLENIGLFDMDGSLADYELSLQKCLEMMRSPHEPPLENLWSDEPYIITRMHAIKSRPGWWRNLPPIESGIAVFNLASRMGFHCQILTKGPKKYPLAWAEKVEWCQDHLSGDIDVHVVSDKKIVYGKFLYDDYPDYMLRWLSHRPRGLGIMPVTPYNANFSHPNVVKYNGDLEVVQKALEIIKNRRPLQPLILPW